MQPKNEPQFISSLPLGKDLFESGAQVKTAKSISSHLQKVNGNFRLIGLDGSWGAGKSNVISIVREELKKSHHVFIYDAWSHQEDLHRRSFLEELTDDLIKAHLLPQKEWTQNLKDLLAKRKETVQKTTPKLGYGIIVGLLTTISLPVALAIASVIKNDLLKIFVSAFPLLFGLAAWIILCVRDPKYRKWDELFSIYRQADLESVKNETISESEPSLREFRNWMYKLQMSLKADGPEIIVVFDNMDRLPPSRVQAIWSSVHTFFVENSVLTRISVIIPFDRVHISESFPSGIERATHFIDKTFSVVFTVPPAVMTDWWNFLHLKYNEAFGDGEKDEYPVVRSTFDRCYDTITPRKIISFINELVALKLTWGNEMELRYISLFICHRGLFLNNPLQEILSKSYLAKVRSLFGEEEKLDEKMSALVYNVPIAIASQVAIQRQTLVAIRNADTTMLGKLKGHRDFFKILEDICGKEELDLEPSVHSINFIDSEINETDEQRVIDEIWIQLVARQKQVVIEDIQFTQSLKVLVRKSEGASRSALLKHILKQFSISRNFQGEAYYSAVTSVEFFLKEMQFVPAIGEIVPEVVMRPVDFIRFVVKAQWDYADYNVTCDSSDLEQHLLNNNSFKPDEITVVPYLTKNFTFPKIKALLEEDVSEGRVNLADILTKIQTYKALCEQKPFLIKLPDRIVNSLLTEAAIGSDEFYELVAMRLAKGDKFKNPTHELKVLMMDNDEAVEKISSSIEWYGSLGELLLLSVHWPQDSLKSVAANLLRKSYGPSKLTLAKILPLFDQIVENTKVSKQVFFNRLSSWSKHFSEAVNLENLSQIAPNVSLFETAIACNNELSKDLIKVGKDMLDAIDENGWIEYISDEDSFQYKLMVFFINSGILKQLPRRSFEAIKSRIITISQDQSFEEFEEAAWVSLRAKFKKTQVALVIKNIRDHFISSSNITFKQFEFFEEMLRVHGGLQDRAGDAFRTIILPVLQDERCFNLIATNSSSYYKLFSKSGSTRPSVVTELRNLVKLNPDRAPLVQFEKDLNKLLGIEVEVLSATYFADSEHSVDVTLEIRRKIEDFNYHFRVANELSLSGDPHYGVGKKLKLMLRINGKDEEVEYCEGEWVGIL